MTATGTLPGLVVTPTLRVDESLPYYLHRLAEANGAPSVSWLPIPPSDAEAPVGIAAAIRLAMTPAALGAVEGLLGRRDGRLVGESWMPMESAAGPYVRIQGAAMPFDAVMSVYAQVCSACLRDDTPYARSDWDLSHVTTCSRHRCQLLDTCPHCSTRLKASRPVLVACGRCAHDLRLAAPTPCSPEQARICDFAAALAPFRFVGLTETVQPAEVLFELVRLLAVPSRLFFEGKRLGTFSKMALAERHRGVQLLAECLEGHRILGAQVHRVFAGWSSHWTGFVSAAVRDERTHAWLSKNDQLDAEICRFLAFEDRQENIAPAYLQYKGEPPRLFQRARVLQELGCSSEELTEFAHEGLITRPRRGLAYDADHIVACRRALATRVLPSDLDAAVGLKGFGKGLLARGVVQSVRRIAFGQLISTAHLGATLDRLLLRVGADTPAGQSTLGEAHPELTGELLAEIFVRLLWGQLPSFTWEEPFTWREMSLSAEDFAAVERAAEDRRNDVGPRPSA